MCGTTTYHIWENMISRTTNPNNKQYNDYGGRGITVCEEWKDFVNFFSDMGERPGNLTLERIDNEKGYSPSNCCWAPRKSQLRNKRSNHKVTYEGRTLCLAEWAELTGINPNTLWKRIDRWSDLDRVFADSSIHLQETTLPTRTTTTTRTTLTCP